MRVCNAHSMLSTPAFLVFLVRASHNKSQSGTRVCSLIPNAQDELRLLQPDSELGALNKTCRQSPVLLTKEGQKGRLFLLRARLANQEASHCQPIKEADAAHPSSALTPHSPQSPRYLAKLGQQVERILASSHPYHDGCFGMPLTGNCPLTGWTDRQTNAKGCHSVEAPMRCKWRVPGSIPAICNTTFSGCR